MMVDVSKTLPWSLARACGFNLRIQQSLVMSAVAQAPTHRSQPCDMAELGFLRCGPQGAGHFGKMVHSGIECGLMAAYAEGLNILRHANMGKQQRDAETTPLRDPEVYPFDFNPPKIAVVSRHGSVIGSWFFDLTVQALRNDADLQNFAGRVSEQSKHRRSSPTLRCGCAAEAKRL